MNRDLRNELLKNLPDEELFLLFQEFGRVELSIGETLCEQSETLDYIYFPEDSSISLISVTSDGLTVEVGAIGCEGLLGVSSIFTGAALPYRATVQAGGAAHKIRVDTLKKLLPQTAVLKSQLLSYFHSIHTQVAQSAICNKFHTVQERVAKWLLLAVHRTGRSTLRYTQEFLSMLLGSGRTSISRTLNDLQSLGTIRTSRAFVTVLQPKRLEKIACECYQILSAGLPEC